MDAISILTYVQSELVHNHWKPYYRYPDCRHALSIAHHLRVLMVSGKRLVGLGHGAA